MCIPPCYVPLAAKELRGADVKVATVVSFPFGYDATAVKIAAVREAVTRGASELDVVMNISKFLSGEFDYVADELASLTQEVSVVAMNNGLNDVVVKVIIETAYLSDKMKRLATQIVAVERRGLREDLDRLRPGLGQLLRTLPCSGRRRPRAWR